MFRRLSRLVVTAGLLCAATLALGGCPLEAPPSNEAAFRPNPGTYYVEQREQALYYFQLAEVRGAENRWVQLPDDGAWFEGAGFYRLAEDDTWSRDDNSAGLTLDELIQLHDPAPTADEAP